MSRIPELCSIQVSVCMKRVSRHTQGGRDSVLQKLFLKIATHLNDFQHTTAQGKKSLIHELCE